MPLTVPVGVGLFAHRLTAQGDADPIFITGAVEVATFGPADVQATVDALQVAAKNLVIGACAGHISTADTILRVKTAQPDEYAVATSASVFAGGLSGGSLPVNCAYLVKKRTNVGGKTNQGRFFLPGPPESIVDGNGMIPNENLTGVQVVLNNYYADVLAAPVVVRYVLIHGTRKTGAAGAAPTTVASLQVMNQIGTQRQRMRR
jgi:hypothetical protein